MRKSARTPRNRYELAQRLRQAKDPSKYVVDARHGLGWSQARLAEKLGTSVRTIIRWEKGQNRPSSAHIEAIAKLLDRPFKMDKRQMAKPIPRDVLGDIKRTARYIESKGSSAQVRNWAKRIHRLADRLSKALK